MEFELIKKDLQISGSLAVRDRDSVFIEASAKQDESGYVYAPSKKRVYNTDELKKAIDVNVFELIPNSPENNLDLLEICACTSSPITISHTPVSPLICPGLKSNISVILQLLELLH